MLFRQRVISFFRYLDKHTNLKIGKEVTYPTPKRVKKKEVPLEEKIGRRIQALLNNEYIYLRTKEDKRMSQTELQKKYAHTLLMDHHLKTLRDYYNYKLTSGKVTSNP